jgi:LuxR family transcriptional regulator, maltose regulon positive regulatory protein
MPILVTRTKVILPRRRAELLTRQRLLNMLYDLMDYKLVIIAAPAGYGKTSLLIDFAHQLDLTVCWYSIDALDRDLARFLAHFITAIANKYPGFGKQSMAALESNMQTRMDTDHLVTIIVNEAYEHIREHFILVIDDYHLINDNKEISYFISRFTQEVDENCHLILATRALLALPDMPLMVARSMVGGLSFEELAFSSDEIYSLVLQNFDIALPKIALEELSIATEGWITGLLLSTQTMRSGMPDRLRIARVARARLYDYLIQQVLNQQPDDVRDFLLKTSVLEEFDLQLCEEVFGADKKWNTLFDNVLENNLYVLPVGENGQWIRYHNLFQDFLQARIAEENPAELELIRKRLVAIYSERDEWEKAYSICKQLNDVNAISDLIVLAGPIMVRNGRQALLADWIDALPAEELFNKPRLMSLRAVHEIILGQSERGLTLLNQAVNALRGSDDIPGLARALARRATVLRFMGKYKESLGDALEAQRLITDEPSLQSYQADALRASGISLYQLGQVKEAISNLNQALWIYQSLGERQNTATILMELGLISMGAGHYRRALEYYDQASGYWREVNNTVRLANLLNNLGVLHHLIGNYEQAASTFEEALVRARQNNYTRMEAYILSSIGDLYSDLDANRAALDAYQKSRELARRIDYHFLLLYTDISTAARFRSMDNLDQAQRYLEAAKNRISVNNPSFEKGLFELEMGQFLLAKGEPSSALGWVEQAVSHLEETEQPVETARGHLHLANAYFKTGAILKALEQLNISLNLAADLDSQHVLVVSGVQAKGLLEIAQNPPHRSRPAGDLLAKVLEFEASISSERKRLRPRTSSIPFAPPKLVIQAFGKAQVERDGNPVEAPEWQNQRKVRELFFFFLTNPEGMTKEEIGLVFWPESSASQLKLQFKNAIYRLRHALGPDIVVFDDDLYWFNRDLDYQYDVEDFLSLIGTAKSSTQSDQKINNFTAALSLYKGLFLPEAEGSWILSERERLRELYFQALVELADLFFESGNYGAALEYCQLALDEEPCLEEAHRLAMRIYGMWGNRAGVNRQFERCKLMLKNQVNATPSPQTVALYETLVH